jgi:NADPH-dependent 2,4-dienoyl-CoA reductase/sulfur reductase-like enzyme/rhodanese-related sulfurtransferase
VKYLIIGGVAGGATVAARLRRLDENAEIVLFERGEYVSYANCGLPYYIGDTINERDKLFVQTVKGFVGRFRIDIRTRQEVVGIQPGNKQVKIKRLSTGETYIEGYDKLVLSPGAEPLRPNIPGINSKKIFTLRNVSDTDAIKRYTLQAKPRHAVVVGGGFIGLEVAENLHDLGIGITVVERADQVMAPLDYSMAAIVHQHLAEKKVKLILEDGVENFEETPEGLSVHLQSGKKTEADMALLSIGVRPETKLAKEAGLKIGSLGGISVNAYMQTSDPDIYALGDAIEVTHQVTGKPALIPLAGPANKQGRIVADNLVYGNKETYSGTIGNSIAKVFDLTVASAGANAKLLKREGIPYLSSYTHSASHAGYYPGALPLSIKILFSPDDGRLLGAQVVGFHGVDKRMEMLAQVIQRKGTIYDLISLEQAYAPPYSSAKDPVNMAGYVADNVLKGRTKTIHWREIAAISGDTVLVDVRTPGEYALGTLPGAINIPVDDLRKRLSELPKDRPIIVTCAIGLRGYLACRILTQNGYANVRNLSGGYKTWHTATANRHIIGSDIV